MINTHNFSDSLGIKKWITDTAAGVCALIFPDRCMKCGTYITRDCQMPLSACFCPSCLDSPLPFFGTPFCPVCGRIFDAGTDHLCSSCLERRPVTKSVRAAFEYKGVIRDGIGLLKYQAKQSLALPFEYYLFSAFESYYDMDDVHLILPVPLHRSKAKKRGFNQSYFLVRNFPRLFKKKFGHNPFWAIDIHSLVRVRATVSQTGLDYSERRENLNKAFSCHHPSKVEGKNILLVDDVYTTGATCNAAAKILIRAGAARVSALVLARA